MSKLHNKRNAYEKKYVNTMLQKFDASHLSFRNFCSSYNLEYGGEKASNRFVKLLYAIGYRIEVMKM